MAGTIVLSLQQQFDSTSGALLAGGRLYFFQAGTSTPQNAYQDQGLTNPYPNPITLEADGRVPFLWFADGTIRVRLTNSGGVVQFDTTTTGDWPVIGSSDGGSGVDTTDPLALFQTGDPLWVPRIGTRSGWVRMNARTIGSATSGATERANADVEALYLHAWANYSDTLFPVTGGRGATAADDWAANKAMGMFDMKGRGPFGLDDMGGTAASRITDTTFATPTAISFGGVGRHTLATTEIPAVTPAGTIAVSDTRVMALPTRRNPSGGNWSGAGGNSFVDDLVGVHTINLASPASGSLTAAFTGTQFGGGTAHNTMPPGALGTWYMKL